MLIEFDDRKKALAEALENAILRGVDVRIISDWYSEATTDALINYLPRFNKELRNKLTDLKGINKGYMDRLKSTGVSMKFTGRPKNPIGHVFPTFGRNHIKIHIVDDVVYTGGMNLGFKSGLFKDIMLKTNKPEWVDVFYEKFFSDNSTDFRKDEVLALDAQTKLFIDAGIRGKSIIYDEALSLIKSAKKNIKFISQFQPHFDLASALVKAKKKGVEVEVIAHHPSLMDYNMVSKVDRGLSRLSSNGELKIHYYEDCYIHSKVILVDDKIAFLGSHNYTKISVWKGTKEISLEIREKALVEEILDWYYNIKNSLKSF